jgi:hypothetical protein
VSVVVQNNQELKAPSLTCKLMGRGRLQRSLGRLRF